MIKANKLTKFYSNGEAKIAALDNVDLCLDEGAFTVVAGRSGSGKTTLLNMIGLLDKLDAGTLTIAGQNVLQLSRTQRAVYRLWHIGFVFQSYNLIRALSARENVAYVLQLRGVAAKERRRIADQWLVEVGLQGLEHRRPDELSGGQQQRVAVARALAGTPDIVLADEPTANLDSQTGEQLMVLMRQLNESHGTTFLIASHDPAVLEAGKQLLRMEDGRIVERINPAPIKTK
ncbi:MAG: ABC transporter ATP-binding protein [Proteobacteria bacterium]|nr:ABC transporter ATP-binding protein [Pseudomonadota bacterium]